MMATNPQRHAYCIIAHNQPRLLQRIVSLIDDERNDIFLHIDKKADVQLFRDLKAEHSKITWVSRINAVWGDISIVKAELSLFKEAAKGDYAYVHLISGSDLPLHSQDFIHNFCQEHQGLQFIGYALQHSDMANHTDGFYNYYHLFGSWARTSRLKRVFMKLRQWVRKGQHAVDFHRSHPFVARCGYEWTSLTGECVRWLVSHEKEVLKYFRYTLCPDEAWKQTFILQSPFKDSIYRPENGNNSSMRLIDWQRGNPYVWQSEDLDELTHSEAFFARKFSENNWDLIEQLTEHVKK